MGPHHPATHGVLRLLVTLEGEVVRDLKPIIGYVHTGIEKTAEDKSYWKVIPVVERMDYLAYYFNAMAFCGAVETLLDARGPQARAVPARHPPRAQPDHEPPRVARHERARPRRDLDVLVLLPRAREDPRPVRDVLRPAHAHALHPGRRRLRGHPAGLGGQAAATFLDDMPDRVDQYGDLLNRNEIVLRRLRGVCPLDEQTLLDLGVTGPLLRAAGNPWDLRKAMPYSSYEDFDFKIPVGTAGRQLRPLRGPRRRDEGVGEDHRARRSTACPRAPHITDDRKVALPPRHELATSMEALIHHFKLVTEGFRVPPGEVYYPIEGPRGELGLLRALRRLEQARARAHARPELRQPPGHGADGARTPTSPTSSRRSRCSTRSSAGSTANGHRSRQGCRASGTAPASPAGTRRPTSRRTRPSVPDPATTPVPASLRARIEAHMAKYPDSRSAAIPALYEVQNDYGWCTPEGIEQAACVMRLTPGYLDGRRDLLRHALHPPRGPAPRLRVHEHLVLAVRRRRALRGLPRGEVGDDPSINLREFECLGACDIAPMVSIDGAYVGPIEIDEVPDRRRADPRRRRRCCRRSSSSAASASTPTRTARDRPPPLQEHRRARPAHARGLRAPRRLPRAAQGARHGAARTCSRELDALRHPRPRRRGLRDGQEGLVPAEGRDGQVPRLQRRRVRARHVQGPRAHAEVPAHAHRGHDHRGVRDRRRARVHLHPRRVRPAGRRGSRRPSRRRAPPATSASASSARTTRSRSGSTAAPAPTSAARRRRCSTRSRASAATRASSRRSRPTRASTRARRSSTTSRRSRPCRAILEMGGAKYAELGVQGSTGTKLVSVSGNVRTPATSRSSSGCRRATSSTASPAARPRAARSSSGSRAARARRC